MAAHDIVQTSTLRAIINRELTGKIVVLTFDASQGFLTHRPLLSMGHLSANNRYMLVDGTWPTSLSEYPRHLKEITGSDRSSVVLEFLPKNREKVIFVSTPNRNALIQEYFATVYNKKFTIQEFSPRTANGVRLYTINAGSK